MDKGRMLIIGARGFLGMHATRAARDPFEVFMGSREAAADPASVQIDISDASSVDTTFRRVKPDAVLLLAALSDIDRCQSQPDLALAVNVHGSEHVANACARANARLLFTSSAAVFDGRKHGYTEEDAPTPLSVYGETKARAEAAVLALLPSAIVLRIALVIGFAGKAGTNAMLDNLAASWASGSPVASPTFEYRNPIDAGTLSSFMLRLLLHKDACGIFHAGAKDSVSRYELNVKLAKRMGYSGDLVQPQTVPASGRAPRGLDHFLITDKLHAVCNTTIPNCDEVIERSFDEVA
ncbi:MAG: SDR family oxidoreductase [Acidobacteriaceae bacterium]